MSFLSFAEYAVASWLVAGLLCVLVLAVLVNWHGPLDGTPIRSVLDDRDRSRHLLDAALAEDREVAALDALFALPARRHP